jgi:hypothetical protein
MYRSHDEWLRYNIDTGLRANSDLTWREWFPVV